MTEPLFTVVIPTYNREDLVLRTLNTVLNQSYRNFEVIVVDNGSTDSTLKILEPFEAGGKIRVVRNEKNLERSRARNIGFKLAKGDYLTLLDSDDFMYKDNLSDAAEFILKNPDYDFFFNQSELVNEDGASLYKPDFPKQENQIKQFAKGNFLSCIGVFISKSIYQNNFFNEDDKILGSEDWEFWIRLRSIYKLGQISKINNAILNHPNRSVNSHDIVNLVNRKKYIINNLLEIDSVREKFGKYRKLMIASSYVYAATSANRSFEFKLALNFLQEAILIKPDLVFSVRYLRVLQIALFKIDVSYK